MYINVTIQDFIIIKNVIVENGLGLVLNANFYNISDILWRSIYLVEETRVPRENHIPVACR